MTENRLTISIEYCHPCNYIARAAWTAQELLMLFGEWTDGITLVPGDGGVFELTVNGQQVYSKKATGKFPDTEELNQTIQKFLS